jgi:hypothetical protein
MSYIRKRQSIRKCPRVLFSLARALAKEPWNVLRLLGTLPAELQGLSCGRDWKATRPESDRHETSPLAPNPLREYFDSHNEGKGVWKWRHYFEVYHEHFREFVGQEVHLVEVGILGGGSLDMWKGYLGPKCTVYGIDIEEGCRKHEADRIRVFIGDQSDRRFWKRFRAEVPRVDILIDDGGHMPHQQIVTLEEMLPHIRPGGVYMCEDIHSLHNEFAAYLGGLAKGLNAYARRKDGEVQTARASAFQAAVHSIHLYPYATVIRKTPSPVECFAAPKHGTQWGPSS